MLGQAAERSQVAGAVAELGEEPHDRLGGMVGADHQAAAGAGDGVLGDHADARLDIADDEVALRRLESFQGFQLFRQGFHRRTDVDGLLFVGADGRQRGLGIGLVLLHLVGQAHGDEAVGLVAGLLAQLLDGALGQQAGGERVDAAADPQHQGLQPGILQALLDEGDAPGDLRLHVGLRLERRLDLQGLGDVALDLLHVRAPVRCERIRPAR